MLVAWRLGPTRSWCRGEEGVPVPRSARVDRRSKIFRDRRWRFAHRDWQQHPRDASAHQLLGVSLSNALMCTRSKSHQRPAPADHADSHPMGSPAASPCYPRWARCSRIVHPSTLFSSYQPPALRKNVRGFKNGTLFDPEDLAFAPFLAGPTPIVSCRTTSMIPS